MWAKDSFVVFLAKTWTDEARLISIQDRLKFKHRFIAPRRNKLGGLVMYWKEEFDLTIETSSKNQIDATICKNKEGEWRFTGFYGELDTQLRHEAWAHLRNLKTQSQAPWLCAGDFLMKLQSNRKNWVVELGLIVRCKLLEIYWTSAVL